MRRMIEALGAVSRQSRRSLPLVGLAGVALLLSACGDDGESAESAEVISIDVSHNQGETHYTQDILLEVADRVEERSGGSIELNVFPTSQLGDIPDLIDQFMAGGNVITVHNMAQAAERGVPSLAAVSAMYALQPPEGSTDPAAILPVLKNFAASDLMQGWRDELMDLGFVMLAGNWYLGERNIITNDPDGHPTPESLDGVALRIPDGSTWQAYFNELPVDAVTLDGSELYTAMQQGTVNGAEGPYSQMLGWSIHELGKSITLTGHGNDIQGFSTGQGLWDSLSSEQQEVLVEAFEWGGAKFSQRTVEVAETDRQTLEDAGLTFVEADREAYQEVATAAYSSENYPEWDPDVLEKIAEAAAGD